MRTWMKAGAVTAVLLLNGGAAVAVSSYQGSDFTRDLDSRREVMACDMESDGNGVRGEYVPNGTSSTHTIYDGNGASNTCAHSGSYSARIYKHRVTEVLELEPDAHGAWVYPR
ncbi:hypothetical protein ABIB53_000011 [Janibacter sp. UYMM211]